MKKIWKIASLIMICLGLSACGTESSSKGEAGLKVYYVTSHPYFASGISEFEKEKKIEGIEAISFESDEKLVAQLATELAAGKGPDVILFSGDTSFDMYKAYKSGHLLDLKTYMENDSNYKSENYIESVVSGGSFGTEQQYALPFSFTIDALYMEESTYQELGLSEEDIVNYESMLQVLDKAAQHNPDKLSQLTPNSLYATQTYWERCLNNADVVDAMEDSFEINQETIVQVKAYMDELTTEREEKSELVKKKASNPFENANTFILNGNYYKSYAAYNGMTQYYAEEKCIVIPWRNPNGKIQPTICDFGVVTAQSEKKQLAYELLKFFMNYEISTATNRPMSVEKTQLQDLLKELMRKESSVGKVPYKSAKLTDKEVEKLWKEILNMDVASFSCVGYLDILEEHLATQGEIDMESLQSKLQRYFDE